MIEPCQHLKEVDVFIHTFRATLYEPEHTAGYGLCRDCGEKLDLQDIPAEAKQNIEYV